MNLKNKNYNQLTLMINNHNQINELIIIYLNKKNKMKIEKYIMIF